MPYHIWFQHFHHLPSLCQDRWSWYREPLHGRVIISFLYGLEVVEF